MRAPDADQRLKYSQHRATAKQRGIPFTLSFEQWWEIWRPHWHLRGRRAGQMCMCRNRDEGGYEVGNVRIATNSENRYEAAVCQLVSRAPRKYMPKSKRTGIGASDSLDWARGRRAFDEYKDESEIY